MYVCVHVCVCFHLRNSNTKSLYHRLVLALTLPPTASSLTIQSQSSSPQYLAFSPATAGLGHEAQGLHQMSTLPTAPAPVCALTCMHEHAHVRHNTHTHSIHSHAHVRVRSRAHTHLSLSLCLSRFLLAPPPFHPSNTHTHTRTHMHTCTGCGGLEP